MTVRVESITARIAKQLGLQTKQQSSHCADHSWVLMREHTGLWAIHVYPASNVLILGGLKGAFLYAVLWEPANQKAHRLLPFEFDIDEDAIDVEMLRRLDVVTDGLFWRDAEGDPILRNWLRPRNAKRLDTPVHACLRNAPTRLD